MKIINYKNINVLLSYHWKLFVILLQMKSLDILLPTVFSNKIGRKTLSLLFIEKLTISNRYYLSELEM